MLGEPGAPRLRHGWDGPGAVWSCWLTGAQGSLLRGPDAQRDLPYLCCKEGGSATSPPQCPPPGAAESPAWVWNSPHASASVLGSRTGGPEPMLAQGDVSRSLGQTLGAGTMRHRGRPEGRLCGMRRPRLPLVLRRHLGVCVRRAPGSRRQRGRQAHPSYRSFASKEANEGNEGYSFLKAMIVPKNLVHSVLYFIA